MPANFSTFGAAIHSLRSRGDVEARLAALRSIVEHRHGPIRLEDGLTENELAGYELPAPLAWWYRWAGRRTEIMSGQNFLFQPNEAAFDYHKLKVLDERLHFQTENQSCYDWSTMSLGDDPPVFGRASANEPWHLEPPTLSEHLILNCIFEAVIFHAEFRACSAVLSGDKLDAIVSCVPKLAIGPWLWCETHFYAGAGVFMTASPVGEEHGRRYFSVWIGSKRKGAMDFIAPLIGDEWEVAAF